MQVLPLLVLLSATSAQVEVSPRTRAVLLLITPKSTPLQASTSDYLQIADAIARDRTSLKIQSSEQAGLAPSEIDQCSSAERLTCWTGHLKRSGARYMLVLAVHPGKKNKEQLVAMVLDAKRAASIIDETAKRQGWRERVENVLFDRAIKAPPTQVETRQKAALQDYFETLFDTHLRPTFETSGHWRPFGGADVLAEPALLLELDGKPLGKTEQPTIQLRAVAPGEHTLTAQRMDGTRAQTRFSVVKGEIAKVQVSFPLPGAHPVRVAARWSGVAFGAVGAALGIYGLVTAGKVRVGCAARTPEADCEKLGAPTFGFSPSNAPSTDPRSVNPKGVLISGLGLALLSTGIAWSVGAWLGPAEEIPWIQLGVGLALGGLAYGIAAGVDQR